jgi:transposase InsO family protein
MESQIDTHDNTLMCYVLEVPRSSFYYYCKHNISNRKLEDEKLKELIYKIWIDSYKRYGAPKITNVLGKLHNVYVSVRKTQKLMRELKIASIIIKSYKPVKQKPEEGEFSNLLNRDFTTTGINEKWVSDITYIWTDECGWCYLATILDLHSKRLIGWKFGKKMTVELVEGALENALNIRGLNNILILHSDRGRQYTAEVYRNYGRNNDNLRLSYSSKGCPYDNAPMESFNAIIKKELVNHTHYETFDQAYMSIFTFIEKWYNRERIHGSISNLTPIEFESNMLQFT